MRAVKVGWGVRPAGLWCALALVGAFWAACGDEAVNTAPQFIGIEPEYRISVGETLTINVSAKDAEGDNFTLAMESGPPGSDFVVSGFGRFVWTPQAQDGESGGKPFDVVFSAVDAKGARGTFRATILVSPSEGEIRFTTSNSRVLDLTRNDTLVARVSVQREDVTEVNFGLENMPAGMTLTQAGGKSAELRWTPEQDQIASKLIWGATITAAAGDGIKALQNMTLTLVAKNCGEGATQVQHTPMGDQRGAGDYAIEAQIVTPDGSPARATLFSRLGGDPNDSGGFDGTPMENTGGDTWRAIIRNPGAVAGQPKDIYYFVVAHSDSDRNLGCLARAPAQGLNSFAAFAAGDESCRSDAFEPNDSSGAAAVLTSDTQGVSLASGQLEAYGLAICEGDKDLFAVDLEPNQGASVLITYNSEVGNMHLRGFDKDGQTVLLESTDMFANESSILLPAATAGRYFIEVSGDPQGYRLYLSLREGVDPNCIDNQFEPNEFATSAPVLPPGTYDDLQICPGDKDYFGVTIPPSHTLTARILFRHADGDLDFFLRDRDERPVASSGSSSDNEQVVFHNDGMSGLGSSFTLEVRPVNGAAAPYVLEIELVEQEEGACQPDFFEPNNTADEADDVPIDGGINNSNVSMCSDEDFYAIALQAGDPLSATIRFEHATSDLDMEILGPNRERLAASEGVEDQEQIELTASTAGNHYVHVYRYSPMGDQDYNLTVRVGEEGGNNRPTDCEADTNEENGARALAQPVDEAQTTNVGLCGADTDWFVIFPSANDTVLGTLTIVPLNGGNLADVRFELVNNSDSVLATGQLSGSTSELEFRVPSGGPHFLRITNTGSSGFIYDLEAISL